MGFDLNYCQNVLLTLIYMVTYRLKPPALSITMVTYSLTPINPFRVAKVCEGGTRNPRLMLTLTIFSSKNICQFHNKAIVRDG
jgi:hypothetical protein